MHIYTYIYIYMYLVQWLCVYLYLSLSLYISLSLCLSLYIYIYMCVCTKGMIRTTTAEGWWRLQTELTTVETASTHKQSKKMQIGSSHIICIYNMHCLHEAHDLPCMFALLPCNGESYKIDWCNINYTTVCMLVLMFLVWCLWWGAAQGD
jgi:hypothetical protein